MAWLQSLGKGKSFQKLWSMLSRPVVAFFRLVNMETNSSKIELYLLGCQIGNLSALFLFGLKHILLEL